MTSSCQRSGVDFQLVNLPTGSELLAAPHHAGRGGEAASFDWLAGSAAGLEGGASALWFGQSVLLFLQCSVRRWPGLAQHLREQPLDMSGSAPGVSRAAGAPAC